MNGCGVRLRARIEMEMATGALRPRNDTTGHPRLSLRGGRQPDVAIYFLFREQRIVNSE